MSGPRQADTLQRAMKISWEGEPAFEAVQATWNLLEPSAASVLAQAHSRGMQVIIKEAAARLGTLAEPAAAYWATRSQLPWN